MQPTANPYEYTYQNSNPEHHHAYLIAPLLELIVQKALPSSSTLRILDLGCGNGHLTYLIAQQGYEVVGIDDSESGIKFARLSYPNCHFIQSSIYDLSNNNDLETSFDVVISAEVIEHLLYPKELVRAAKKCLKPSGQLILTTPYHGYLKNLVLALSGKLDRHFTVLWDGGHVKFFSVATLKTMLELEGFTDIQFKFAGRLPLLWKSMLCSCTPNQS
jgi:2-polyprenyl-3-methyl-5-hydroxy-6-metoxy-1,4-benzoquinol methylase